MLPTQRLGYNTKSKKGTFLTAWKSESDPSTGIYTVEGGRATEIPAQVIIWINRSTPFWRSGPWDKSKFIGIPAMDDQYLSGFKGDENVEQGTQYFSYKLSTLAAYLEISSQGSFKLMYAGIGRNWSVYLETQNNPCGIYGACGPFGVCNVSESPICKCLKGFVPKSDQEWSKGDWTRGCVRKTKLFCERLTNKKSVPLHGKEDDNDDGFLKIVRAKVPDYHQYITSLNLGDEFNDCKIQCLNNCSCLAYALVNNIGCLVWCKNLTDIQEYSNGGVDIYIRLARKELGEEKPIKLIASLTAIGLMIILVAIVLGLHRLRANQKESIPSSRDTLRVYIGKHDPSELLIYDFDIILTATDNFSITNKLG